jgi:hypothetical protein
LAPAASDLDAHIPAPKLYFSVNGGTPSHGRLERVTDARQRYEELMATPATIDEILAVGAERIRPIAEATMAEVRDKMGLR